MRILLAFVLAASMTVSLFGALSAVVTEAQVIIVSKSGERFLSLIKDDKYQDYHFGEIGIDEYKNFVFLSQLWSDNHFSFRVVCTLEEDMPFVQEDGLGQTSEGDKIIRNIIEKYKRPQ